MSHQRYPSHGDAVKEPHSVSLKVLRLSRPSLVAQYPVQPPPLQIAANPNGATGNSHRHPAPMPASLAYSPVSLKNKKNDGGSPTESTNSDPFILSPMVNLPPSFGSAYVGETFSCTLCVNHDAPHLLEGDTEGLKPTPTGQKMIRDVRIEAEMKTPATAATATSGGGGGVVKLSLSPPGPGGVDDTALKGHGGVDLLPGETLQKIVNFDLKDEGNHVLAVTVSYYEATETSGRTRTFRKLYQFICKASLIVRTKPGPLPRLGGGGKAGGRRWVLEAQLENCSEDAMQLEKADMELEEGLVCRGLNWDVLVGDGQIKKPVLRPGEVEQVCFVIEEVVGDGDGGKGVQELDGRIVFGVLGVGWRSEMGNRGFLTTGKLGTRHIKPV